MVHSSVHRPSSPINPPAYHADTSFRPPTRKWAVPSGHFLASCAIPWPRVRPRLLTPGDQSPNHGCRHWTLTKGCRWRDWIRSLYHRRTVFVVGREGVLCTQGTDQGMEVVQTESTYKGEFYNYMYKRSNKQDTLRVETNKVADSQLGCVGLVPLDHDLERSRLEGFSRFDGWFDHARCRVGS